MPLRIFLTDECPDLEAELRRIGHEIVGGPADRVGPACAGGDWHPNRYNVVPHIQAHRPDVCLFVGPLRIVPVGFPDANGERGLSEFGYVRDQIVKTRGVRSCIPIAAARPGDDPDLTRRYRSGMCPKCVGVPHFFDAWATTDPGSAAEHARERRCALYRTGEGGAAGIVAVIEAIRGRVPYRAGKDGRVFGP